VVQGQDKGNDLRFEVREQGQELVVQGQDKDKDLQIGPRGSSRTRTFLEDNNTA